MFSHMAEITLQTDNGILSNLLCSVPRSLSHHICIFVLGGQLIKWFNDRQGKRVPATQVLRIFHQICRAVAHMHKQNPPIIHRDLKVVIRDRLYKRWIALFTG